MNQQIQNSPSKPFEPVTVPDVLGDPITLKVARAIGRPSVWIHEGDHDHGITLLPDQAYELAEALHLAYRSAYMWERRMIQAGQLPVEIASQGNEL